LPLRLRALVAEHRWLAAVAAVAGVQPASEAPAASPSVATPAAGDEDVIDLRARSDRRRTAP